MLPHVQQLFLALRLSLLWKYNIMHMDIKPNNILVCLMLCGTVLMTSLGFYFMHTHTGQQAEDAAKVM